MESRKMIKNFGELKQKQKFLIKMFQKHNYVTSFFILTSLNISLIPLCRAVKIL